MPVVLSDGWYLLILIGVLFGMLFTILLVIILEYNLCGRLCVCCRPARTPSLDTQQTTRQLRTSIGNQTQHHREPYRDMICRPANIRRSPATFDLRSYSRPINPFPNVTVPQQRLSGHSSPQQMSVAYENVDVSGRDCVVFRQGQIREPPPEQDRDLLDVIPPPPPPSLRSQNSE